MNLNLRENLRKLIKVIPFTSANIPQIYLSKNQKI